MARDVEEAERITREVRDAARDARLVGKRREPGGTPGGMGEFVVGVLMTLAGGGLLVSRMMVSSGLGALFGFNVTGPALLGMLVGFGFLFFSARSVVGWLLTVGSFLTIFVAVLAGLRVWLAPTPFPILVGIFVLLGGGLGLVAKAVRAH
ncbi:MAG: hypothetical protein ACOZNI_28600 [Myxococcota bacterium]